VTALRRARSAHTSESAHSELGEEQAALRRVATLVARGDSPDALFAMVAEEAGVMLNVDGARVVRFIGEDEIMQLEGWTAAGLEPLPVGPLKLENTSLATEIMRTGRAVRIEDYASVNRVVPWFVRQIGIRSGVAAPIVVDGRLWGAMLAWSLEPRPLPANAERRLVAFTELVGVAISNTASREELTLLAREQAALRRVATLVAHGVSRPELFQAVCQEVGMLLGVSATHLARFEPDGVAVGVGSWSTDGRHVSVGSRSSSDDTSVAGAVRKTGRPARQENYARASPQISAQAQALGIHSSVAAPIVLEGHLWGVLIASSTTDDALPADTESRITAFAELVATAISNSEARVEVGRLAGEQTALRRVATLVARGSSGPEVFAEVAREVGELLGADSAWMHRYEHDGNATVVATWGPGGRDLSVGARFSLDGDSVVALVLRTGRPARFDDYTHAAGETGDIARKLGLRSAVGSPIKVGGRLWGAMTAVTAQDEPLPADAASKIDEFTELVATAVSNAEARIDLGQLAREQEALRRVATLVARGVSQPELFQAVSHEVGLLLDVDATYMGRYEGETAIGVGSWSRVGDKLPGRRVALEGTSVTARVFSTGRPARVDDYDDAAGEVAGIMRQLGIRSAAGAPIVVDGRPWGVMNAASYGDEPLPGDTESRIAAFTELVATAISNSEARVELARLAGEQAALRRVATLVARGRPSREVFAEVACEVGELLDAESAWMDRYDDDGKATVVASWGAGANELPVGTRFSPDGDSVVALVRRTGRSARVDDYARAAGYSGDIARKLGLRSGVGCPIVVGGRLWGAMLAGSARSEPLPADAESHVEEFTALVATAISNLQARSELAASRARIVAATDEERRRVVRDLHDGAQQRLVHTVVTLKLARRELESEGGGSLALVTEALNHAEEATAELRELAHGILPSVLTRGGLRAGVVALASRMPVPVDIGISVQRFPSAVEATAYFIVAEALTNVAKHAHAGRAQVTARAADGTLQVQVRDDGVGGARSDGGGLLGLADRLGVLDGSLRVESPSDGGTLIAANIPITGVKPVQ
jgi:GAF domain-containing protein